MDWLNPYAKVKRTNDKKAAEDAKKNKASILQTKKANRKAHRKQGRKFLQTFKTGLSGADKATQEDYSEYIRSQKVGKDCMKE